MKNTLFISLFFSIVFSASSVGLYHYFFSTKVGYVQSLVLLEGYEATKEARSEIDQEKNKVSENLEKLKREYEAEVKEFEKDLPSLTKEQKELRIARLNNKEGTYVEYSKKAFNMIEEEEAKLTNGILNQINSYVEEYGKENNYSIILGTTSNGSLMYAERNKDLTADVLKYINKKYSGR